MWCTPYFTTVKVALKHCPLRTVSPYAELAAEDEGYGSEASSTSGWGGGSQPRPPSEAGRKMRNARRKLEGENPAALMIDDLEQASAFFCVRAVSSPGVGRLVFWCINMYCSTVVYCFKPSEKSPRRGNCPH